MLVVVIGQSGGEEFPNLSVAVRDAEFLVVARRQNRDRFPVHGWSQSMNDESSAAHDPKRVGRFRSIQATPVTREWE
jgi:hypothetical protein